MTDEERNRARDVLDGLLRDFYSRGVADATSEYEDTIDKLKEQSELMLSILKDIDTQIKVGYDVYNILTPETISDISSVISKVEGDDDDKQKYQTHE